MTSDTWQWELANDAAEVHELLCTCDRYQGMSYNSPVPSRRLETTERHVLNLSVHLLRHGKTPAATFTLTENPPFDHDTEIFPNALNPLYLQRLAVHPDLLREGVLVGLQCVRRAMDVAKSRSADALRCEVNPELSATSALLRQLGFKQCRPALHGNAGSRRAYLHCPV